MTNIILLILGFIGLLIFIFRNYFIMKEFEKIRAERKMIIKKFLKNVKIENLI